MELKPAPRVVFKDAAADGAFEGQAAPGAAAVVQHEDQKAQAAHAFGVGFASSQEIDALGIVTAVRVAIRRALDRLSVAPEHLLLDFLHLPDLTTPQTSLVKGDERVLSIAAASVLAKTARDAQMIELDRCYPGYGFASNKGYGTQMHRDAIQLLGPSPVHRASFHIHSDV